MPCKGTPTYRHRRPHESRAESGDVGEQIAVGCSQRQRIAGSIAKAASAHPGPHPAAQGIGVHCGACCEKGLHGTAWHGMVDYGMAWRGMGMAGRGMAWRDMVWHGVALACTAWRVASYCMPWQLATWHAWRTAGHGKAACPPSWVTCWNVCCMAWSISATSAHDGCAAKYMPSWAPRLLRKA